MKRNKRLKIENRFILKLRWKEGYMARVGHKEELTLFISVSFIKEVSNYLFVVLSTILSPVPFPSSSCIQRTVVKVFFFSHPFRSSFVSEELNKNTSVIVLLLFVKTLSFCLSIVVFLFLK